MNAGVSIEVYQPLPIGNELIYMSNQELLTSYSHTIDANGGYNDMRAQIYVSRNDLDGWIDRGLGRRVHVNNGAGSPVWEGFVNQIDINVGGLSLSIGPLLGIANKIKVKYTTKRWDTNPPIGGEAAEIDWLSDTTSQAAYGIVERIISGGEGSSSEMTTLQSIYLAQNAYPKSSQSLSLESPSVASLSLSCLGYYHWLSAFTYTYTTYGTSSLSTKIGDVLTADPNGFLGTPNIATNALTVSDGSDQVQTGLSVIQSLVALGDGSDNRYLFSVGENRVPTYQAAPTTVEYVYYATSNVLKDLSHAEVYPWDMKAGVWVFIPDITPSGGVTPPSSLLTDPRFMFVEQVSYNSPFGVSITGATEDLFKNKLNSLGLGGSF